MSSRYKSQYHTRDGTVLPPTMTSRRFQPATVSVVNMSLATTDVDCAGLGLPRHHRCYDDPAARRRRGARRGGGRRRRRHDDDVEPMDTLDHRGRHVTDDVTAPGTDAELPPQPVRTSVWNDGRAPRRARLLDEADQKTTWQPKWTSSSRYLLTQADRRRRRAAKSRHHVDHDVTRHHSPSHAAAADAAHDNDGNYDFARRTSSSPVRHTTNGSLYTIRYDTIDLRALKSSRDHGQLNLAHDIETKKVRKN